jgi:hypothetical protein
VLPGSVLLEHIASISASKPHIALIIIACSLLQTYITIIEIHQHIIFLYRLYDAIVRLGVFVQLVAYA